jgi:predicted Fe-S protein YdhL (DUF1289 family)
MNSGSNDTKSALQDGSHSLSTGDNESDSPCIGVCTTLYDEICQGCGRTLGEVSNWVFFSQEEKDSVWKRIREEGTATRFQRQAKENKPA